jgi:hypothetical protein
MLELKGGEGVLKNGRLFWFFRLVFNKSGQAVPIMCRLERDVF